MSDFREGELYILLTTKRGSRSAKGSHPSASTRGKNAEGFRDEPLTEVLAGSLLKVVERNKRNNRTEYELETIDESLACDLGNIRVTCVPGEEISNLSLPIFNLLRPIPTCKERLEVFNDSKWISDGLKVQLGDQVFVKLKGEQSEIRGFLRFKGAEVPDSKGIIFGVELEERRGTSDGKYRGIHFFQTAPEHAVFVPLHKIRRYKDGWQMKSRMRADMDGNDLPQVRAKTPKKPCLETGERVVWMSDYGPERGVVKWIGILPGDHSSSTTVGVEFDRKVGSGTGKYKDERLFFAKQGHASLVPPIGLIKESEFDGTTADYVSDLGFVEDPLYVDISAAGGLSKPSESGYAGSKQMITTSLDGGNKGMMGSGKVLVPDALSGGRWLGAGKVEPGSEMSEMPLMHQHQDIGAAISAQQMKKMSLYHTAEGAVGGESFRNASSGTNPLYEHKRLQEKSSNVGNASSLPKHQSPPSSGGLLQESGILSKSGVMPPPRPPQPQVPDPDLDIGSLVQVQLRVPLYGIIRWIGRTDDLSDKMTAGLEMEEELSAGTDGIFCGTRYFTCPPKRAFFVPLHRCTKDQRYNFFSNSAKQPNNDFGGTLTPDLPGDVSPPDVLTIADLNAVCGKNRGIQGHHNSCYLDATLFCMFYFSTVFDAIFNRPANHEDLPEYPEVQRVLKEGIVNPLRKFNYVRADKVLKLRELLDKLGTVPGMMGEEKDPEEFLNALLTQIMKADPILQLSSGQHAYFYQLFIEEDEKLLLPTTQKLVELSFLQGNVKLKEVPPCLMIQMPRFGKDYKMFHRIVPSLELDITHIVENCPRDCIVCGGLATYECKDCYQVHGPGLNTTAFCEVCVNKSHKHQTRRNHKPKPITTAEDFLAYYDPESADNMSLPRETMELFAVICIQTSHYVSFVKCGLGPDAPWVFFDSMADRMGEQGGYNIPEVVHIPKFAEWLDKKSLQDLHQSNDDRDLPEHLRRVLCDGYMCMYQSPSVMMYQ